MVERTNDIAEMKSNTMLSGPEGACLLRLKQLSEEIMLQLLIFLQKICILNFVMIS